MMSQSERRRLHDAVKRSFAMTKNQEGDVIASFKQSWMKNVPNKNSMSSCFREKRRFCQKFPRSPVQLLMSFLHRWHKKSSWSARLWLSQSSTNDFFKICIPYGHYVCWCGTIIIIVEQVCTIICPLPLFFRAPIGQRDPNA